ncbi:hypothetical protein D3C85_729750 [compost metagenome]
MTTGIERSAFLQGGFPFPGNRFADEVDHAADVVRAVLHGGATAHDIDPVDGRQGHREQRQPGLAIRREGKRNAIGQGLHPAAAAFIQAAYGNLRQGAGAGFVEDFYARHPLQGIVDATHAGLVQVGFLDHRATAGVGENFRIGRATEHVATDHHRGDVFGFGRLGCGRFLGLRRNDNESVVVANL